MARTTTQRKRRKRARDSSAKSSASSSDAASEDDREESDEERRWQRRRSCQDSKGKGKELVKEEDDEESRSRSSRSEEGEEAEHDEERKKDEPQALDEICGICLSEGGNERGKLDCCDHAFCFGCIMEWAKVESRCPMCKQRFLTVTRPAASGPSRSRNRVFRIPTRDQVYEPSEEEIRLFTDPYQNTVCTECQEAGDEGLLLLCDRCDAASHTYCVGLGRSVPRGDWFCQGCQTVACESSGEDDDGDITFDTTDVDEGGGSASESILALLVADIQPNLFAGRTRRSAANQGPVPLRRSNRRRARRSITNSGAAGLSGAFISMSSTRRRGFIPTLVDSYGVARTLSRQRQVQATVQNRLQNMRDNWNRYRSGELQFASARHSVGRSGSGSEEAGSLPLPSMLRARDQVRMVGVVGGEAPSAAISRVVGRSAEDAELDRAWAMMDQARRLESGSSGASQLFDAARGISAPDRRNREVKLQETPVAARTRVRHPQGDPLSMPNTPRGCLDERHSLIDAHSGVNSFKDRQDERHSEGVAHSKTSCITEGLDVFLNTRSSDSRDRDIMGREGKASESSHMDISLSGDNSRSGYHLCESSQLQTSRAWKYNTAVGDSSRSPTLWESRSDTEVLDFRSILDSKDNSKGSGGVFTRGRELRETQGLHVRSLLDDRDSSRGSTGATVRRRDTKDTELVQGRSILDDKDNSRGSTGPTTRRESERNRLLTVSQSNDQAMSRNPERDEAMRLMKEQCSSLVHTALKPIFDSGKIDKCQYKDFARSATHTILSSLGVPGLKHGTDVVSLGTVICDHEHPTSSSLIPGCCNLCVGRHINRFVKNLVKEKIVLHKKQL